MCQVLKDTPNTRLSQLNAKAIDFIPAMGESIAFAFNSNREKRKRSRFPLHRIKFSLNNIYKIACFRNPIFDDISGMRNFQRFGPRHFGIDLSRGVTRDLRRSVSRLGIFLRREIGAPRPPRDCPTTSRIVGEARENAAAPPPRAL